MHVIARIDRDQPMMTPVAPASRRPLLTCLTLLLVLAGAVYAAALAGKLPPEPGTAMEQDAMGLMGP